jgi:diaminohydroxyphosphoribosylaminopyrimidine deaminase/5-amino-6-(5-phosphoribosylamino)uracil reductase
MSLESDQTFMRHAIRLAMNGRGRVEPNPMVGCVMVKDGRVIGEGFHQEFGGPHAEPNALASCTESPAGATVYVTLEPCCHVNKKTPPCVPRLIEAKVGRVVIGCLDPNPDVNGRGVAMLRAAAIVVDGPLLEAEAKQLIAPFIARTVHGRPYVTLKWAQTADGKVAGAGGKRLQISNDRSMVLVHQLRARSDAVAIGIETALADDPLLTPRGATGARRVTRIVLDSHLRLPLSSNLVKTASEYPLLVYCAESCDRWQRDGNAIGPGVEVVGTATDSDGHIELREFLSRLPEAMTHLLVEPGPTLARSLFERGLADRVWVFSSSTALNEPSAPSATPIPEHYLKTAELNREGDVLTEYLNPQSAVFFAPERSADLPL